MFHNHIFERRFMMPLVDSFLQSNPSSALVRALKALLDAPSKEAANAVLIRDQALLLTSPAVQLLYDLHKENPVFPGPEGFYDPPYIVYHHALLTNAHMYGIPRGWQEADKFAAKQGKTREQLRYLVRDLSRGFL